MKGRASILLLLIPALLHGEPESVAKNEAILTWNNRETLAGTIAEATPISIAWNTPMFENALVLHSMMRAAASDCSRTRARVRAISESG